MADRLVTEHWDRRAGLYNNSISRDYSDQRSFRAWKKVYAEAIGEGSGRLMDCGCGPGTVTMYISDLGYDITDYDQSAEMLKNARKNAETLHIDAEFVQGNAEDMPFEDGTFDIIVSQNMLWTVPHPEKVLSEWYRVLKEGGRIVYIDGDWFNDPKKTKFRMKVSHFMTSLYRKGRETRKERDERERMDDFRHLWSFDAHRPGDDLKLVSDAGFEDVHVRNGIEKSVLHGIKYWRYGFIYNYFMIIGNKRTENRDSTDSMNG
jgi:ubiquinone/menaquinone biosynthesis C-methylase UbiE